MAYKPRYPTQYRVHDAVFSLFLIQAVTSVIETLGNPEEPFAADYADERRSNTNLPRRRGDAENIDR